MGKRGRFGKYGDIKRLDRLRHSGDRGVFRKSPPNSSADRGGQRFFTRCSRGKVNIRPVKCGDLDFIRELSELVFRQYGPYDQTLPRWAQAGSTASFLAEKEGEPLGFAILGPMYRDQNGDCTAELLAIAVSPSQQGKGIGKIILYKVLDTAKDLGINRVVLHTAEANLPAKKLFSRHGFITVERKKGFYHGGQDAVMMARILEP